MMDVILVGMRLTAVEQFTTIHNYIDTDNMVLRKGAVAAYKGQKLLIPINMRDGSLICIGKGNEEWNCSAPHGAGRLMSRRAAFNSLSMEEFQREMKGIYTTCVVPDTLDESPMAYKNMDEIVAQIGPTAKIVERIRPVYNFKAAD
jgi:RNA-splicing ligase RtcB